MDYFITHIFIFYVYTCENTKATVIKKGSDLVLDYVHLIDHKCHKINPNCGGSYIDCPDWIKNKIGTITPINNKCFQCAEIKL